MQSASAAWESERATAPVEGQAGLRIGLLTVYTALFFLAAVPIATQRLLWSDELFTLFLSQGHSASETWKVLATGADAMPPAFHALTHAALALPGPLELLIRLPEILGFWLMGVCLFAFTARRTSPWHGAVAALLPGIMAAFLYAVEARSYGLVLGFTGLALVCWQKAGETDSGKLAPAGFGLALMGATAVHYYAILLLFPFAIGEAVRSWQERRLRPILWLGMGAALLPIAAAFPLVRGAARMAHGFWARAGWNGITESYTELAGEFLLAAVFLISLAVLAATAVPVRRTASSRQRLSNVPPGEVALILALAVLPVVAVAAARFTTGAYTPRYAIAAVPGISVLLTWALYTLTGSRRTLTAAILMMVCVIFALKSFRIYRSFAEDRQQQASLVAFLGDSRPPSVPVVVADPHLFVQLSHYASPVLRRRIVYLADPALSLRDTGTDTVDSGLLAMAPISGMRVDTFRAFVESTPRFLVYGYPGDFAWIVPELLSRNFNFTVAGASEGRFLLMSTKPPAG